MVAMLALTAFVISLIASNAQNLCTYSFHVDHEDGCSAVDDPVAQLKTTVNELQSQISSLLQQNTQLMIKIDRCNVELEGLPKWKEDWRAELHRISQSASMTAAGAEYIRWGRTVCPNNASLIYSGFAAGSHYTHTGGSSELLCLPPHPEWGQYMDGFQGESHVHGTEYETGYKYNGNDVFSKRNAGWRSLNNHNVPCAVCYIHGRNTVKKFPALVNCPDGWTREYAGYLMAGHYTQKNHIQAVCLDEAPEVAESGEGDQTSARFYNMEARCGALPCPHYVDGRELTCAICSR